MSDRPDDPKTDEQVEDLEVPEAESDDVKGGVDYAKIGYEANRKNRVYVDDFIIG
jgi:hypothetical protein